jgi:hypothetical protein
MFEIDSKVGSTFPAHEVNCPKPETNYSFQKGDGLRQKNSIMDWDTTGAALAALEKP